MGDGVLFLLRRLGKTLLKVFGEKERIVAEAIFPALFLENGAEGSSLGGVFSAVGKDEGDGAAEVGGAVGAAACIAVGLGMIPSLDHVKELIPAKYTYTPNKENKAVYDRNFTVFQNLYKANKKNFAILNG